MQNIIICQTPLQVLIAEKIIERYYEESFVGIYITYSRNSTTPKIKHYISKLEKISDNFFHFDLYSPKYIGGVSCILSLQKRLSKHLYKNKYNKLFLANINSELMYFLADNLSYQTLMTFDDGFGNINFNGVFYKDNVTFKKKVIRLLFRLKSSLYSFKSDSQKHFTIYKDIPNVFTKTEYISLFSTKSSSKDNMDDISIFLGQPLYLLNSKKFDHIFINNILNKLDFDFYLPHPLEKMSLNNIPILNTELIAEEYIQQLLITGKRVTIYSFISSAMFNFINSENVKVISITNKKLSDFFPKEYDFIRSLGIDTKEIEPFE